MVVAPRGSAGKESDAGIAGRRHGGGARALGGIDARMGAVVLAGQGDRPRVFTFRGESTGRGAGAGTGATSARGGALSRDRAGTERKRGGLTAPFGAGRAGSRVRTACTGRGAGSREGKRRRGAPIGAGHAAWGPGFAPTVAQARSEAGVATAELGGTGPAAEIPRTSPPKRMTLEAWWRAGMGAGTECGGGDCMGAVTAGGCRPRNLEPVSARANDIAGVTGRQQAAGKVTSLRLMRRCSAAYHSCLAKATAEVIFAVIAAHMSTV